MNFIKIGTLIFLSCIAFTETCLAQTLDKLRCEYLHNPLGIDVATPRLSWIISSNQRGTKQKPYRVLVASKPELLAKGQGDLWDSGIVKSDQSVHIEYAGVPLPRAESATKVRAELHDEEAEGRIFRIMIFV